MTTLSNLPRTIKKQISWIEVFKDLSIGDSTSIDCGSHEAALEIRVGAHRCLTRQGYGCTVRIDGSILIIRVIARRERKAPAPKAPRPDQTRKPTETIADIYTRIRETIEEINYWKRQQVLRENHGAKVEAGARVLVWESQLRTLQGKLAALQSKQTCAGVAASEAATLTA